MQDMSDSLPVLARPGRRPLTPRQSSFTRRFWQALGEGRFSTTRCSDCGRLAFPPRPVCPHCWGQHVEWNDLSGRGRLYAQTRVHAASRAFAADLPYRLCIVDLDEGLRIATRLEADEQPQLDCRVRLVVLAYEDGPSFAAVPVAE